MEYDFADLFPEVAPDVAGVTEAAVIRCARLATRYFCRETGFLTIESQLLNLVADQATYQIPADALGRPIVRALEVWVNGDQLEHRSADQLDRESDYPTILEPKIVGTGNLTYNTFNNPWRTATGFPPQFYHQDKPNTVRIVRIPDQAATAALRIVSSVQPALAHLSVDDYLINNWYEILVVGTKAELFKMPQKPWSDAAKGARLEAQFLAETATVLAAAVAGYASNDHVVGHVRSYP